MEKIILEVPKGTAQKWQQASAKLKRRAAQMVERVLLKGRDEDQEMHNDPALAEALRFYDSIQIDLSDYKFDRDEANER